MSELYEIEYKGKIEPKDIEKVRDNLNKEGFSFVSHLLQEDIYLDMQDKILKKEDKALRIRKEKTESYLTYKSKKINEEMGNTLKAREEIEIAISISSISSLLLIFERLGIKKEVVFKKERELYKKEDLIVSIDHIDCLGYFVEIEKKSYDVEFARNEIMKLKKILLPCNVKDIEKTYIELYLEVCKKLK